MVATEGQDRRKEEERVRKEKRLPPGQSLTFKFPVLHYGPVPSFNPAVWDFRVWGEVEEEKRWTWAEFNDLPRAKIQMDIHCVTRWSKFDTIWEGVSVKMMVELGLIKIKPSATHVMQHAEYGFTVNLPLEVALQDSFLLATHLNGEPITLEHGYPLRGAVGLIPGRDDLATPYFWKGAKWLRSLEFMSRDRLGFWEQAGYHNRADVWREERFD
ncbi:MAG: molybdopterin-dependent oxidoreductase [Anaerolineaceae bacterium]|jgi:DMSO/TMAO reductase YedYZ molybdopterin-dependent catalytic subunit|nr:molybdopterin-dependent oxidoreductase [Anaerolineaceae bacterium]OQY87566.1 MAG: sulfite oxidase-like oxidoreductase [Anaerolineae bacterium UTCFX1]